MAQLKDLIVTGAARVLGKLYASEFVGKLTGNADTATKATQDSGGQVINTTYLKGLSVSGKTITYTKGNGTTGTITTQDTVYSHPNTSGNKHIPAGGSSGQILRWSADGTAVWGADNNTTYSTGTASVLGLTKLYTGTGTATDGTMTQNAITTALNGKSGTGHTHNYAGSSSAGGAATSANKLATARTVSGGTDITLSYSYDGSANSSASIGYYSSNATNGNTNNYPFHRFAKLDTITGSYVDNTMTVLLTQDYNGGAFGIARISLRTNNVANKEVSQAEVKWLVRSGFNADAIQIGIYNVAGATYADAFLKLGGSYCGTIIRAIASGIRGSIARTWTLINSKEVNSTTSSDPKTSTESYVNIATAGTKLHNQAYSTIVSGSDSGTVSYSNSTGSASTSTKLTTARTINGTSFDGSANITTANWGTARTIGVGNTSKSVNGSANVSWSLAEIGVHVSTTEPKASDGQNGDIWIVYE